VAHSTMVAAGTGVGGGCTEENEEVEMGQLTRGKAKVVGPVVGV
jgi:hypothetical protein